MNTWTGCHACLFTLPCRSEEWEWIACDLYFLLYTFCIFQFSYSDHVSNLCFMSKKMWVNFRGWSQTESIWFNEHTSKSILIIVWTDQKRMTEFQNTKITEVRSLLHFHYFSMRKLSLTSSLYPHIYLTLENTSLNCMDPLTNIFFSIYTYQSTTWSMVVESKDAEPWIWRADCKVIYRFSIMQLSVPNSHVVRVNCSLKCSFIPLF